jgi:hypothetical protein
MRIGGLSALEGSKPRALLIPAKNARNAGDCFTGTCAEPMEEDEENR